MGRLLFVVVGGALIASAWPALALGQSAGPPPAGGSPQQANGVPTEVKKAAEARPATADLPQVLERLGKMEQRLEWLTRQNQELQLQNKALRDGLPAPIKSGSATTPDATETRPFQLLPSEAAVGADGASAQPDRPADVSPSAGQPTRGGGSSAGGGDPQTIGRAQEIGNLHLGKLSVKTYYDVDNGGLFVSTQDGQYTLGISGMTQIDGMLYARPTPGIDTSSGFYAPRTRVYFEGQATQWVKWEYSFQNFYDTMELLDAYANFRIDPALQIQVGRYKAPFGYEWYRIHIWDLPAPERSVWAVNYEANRRFGADIHGALLEERIEYALGSFNSQRNSDLPSNAHQDFLAFLNFKPFYSWEEGSLVRNLQFGASCDVGVENQSLKPAVLHTNVSPGGAAINSTAAANAAETPFLAFNPTVIERGGRALWETHLAYYYGGLTFLAALEGGHEGYAKSAKAVSVHVPVNGWFVQTAYILTGETIRDRTLLQPLRPFNLSKGQFGLGAWEVSARFSHLDLGSEVFTAGLADPTQWTRDVDMVDVGLNWYLNQFVKVYFDWEHPIYDSPVLDTRGGHRTSSDLFWARAQIYF